MNHEKISYTEREIESLASISRKTLQGWRQRGVGPPWVKAGPRLVRYPAQRFHEWLNSQPCGSRVEASR